MSEEIKHESPTVSPSGLPPVPLFALVACLSRLQRELLTMQRRAQSQSSTLRLTGNGKDAAHLDTASLVLGEVMSLVNVELEKASSTEATMD